MDYDFSNELEQLQRELQHDLQDYNFQFNLNEDSIDGFLRIFAPIAYLFTGVFLFFSLAMLALSIVAYWFLFKKAGQPGWAAVVPFYNAYILFKITWGSGWLFLLLLIPIAGFVIWIITMVKLSKAYGQGGGWACGLIFLNVIFLCITAFSKKFQYVGVPTDNANAGQGGGNGQYYGQQGYSNPNGGASGFYAPSQQYQPQYQQPVQQPTQQPVQQPAETSPQDGGQSDPQ